MFTNQLPAAWRQYSPGGKRRRITKIPFNGVVNNKLRAMGTKRVPVMSSRFSAYPEEFLRAREERNKIGPVYIRGRQATEQRRPFRAVNEAYRSAIEMSREVRGWKRELDPVRQALRAQRLHINNLRLATPPPAK